jgi:germination protein M
VRRPRIQAGMPSRAFAASVLALCFLAAGCGSGDEGSGTPAERSTIPPTVETKGLPALPAVLRVYFLSDGKVSVATRSVVAGPAVGRAALVQLLQGPTGAETARRLSSEIPPGTKLEDLELNDGTATVVLSESLDEAAIAQVVFTLTQFPSVQRVRLEGEEHVRSDFEAETPSVLVESPVPGQDVHTPVQLEGTANTFEATFNVELVDADGTVLAERFVTATSGSGTRGTFDAELSFEITREGPGELVVFELSAEDGSRIHEVRIPVEITLFP